MAAYQAESKSGGHKYHALGGQRLSGWIAAEDSQRQLADAGRDAGACAAGVTRCPAVVGGGDSGRELWSVGGAASPDSRGSGAAGTVRELRPLFPRRSARFGQRGGGDVARAPGLRSEEHTSELPSLMRISYAVFCLKKKTIIH